jgi:hypothetical protein
MHFGAHLQFNSKNVLKPVQLQNTKTDFDGSHKKDKFIQHDFDLNDFQTLQRSRWLGPWMGFWMGEVGFFSLSEGGWGPGWGSGWVNWSF